MIGYIISAIAGMVLHILVVVIVNAIPGSWLERKLRKDKE